MKHKTNNIIIFVVKYKYYIILFLLMTVISFLLPLSGDDWGNYNPSTSLRFAFDDAVRSYFAYESRLASRFIINLLVYHRVVWNFFNATMLLLIYWSFIKIFNIKKDLGYILLGMALIAIPCGMFAQVYGWITGNITYLFPSAIILSYYAYSLTYVKKYNCTTLIIFSLINFIAPLFVDHIGPAIFVANVVLLLKYYSKNKKISYGILLLTVISLISIFMVFFSPGSANRLATTEEFASLSLVGKIIHNYPNFMDYIYAVNPIMTVLMIIPIAYSLISSNKINKKIMYIIIFLISIIPVYSLIYHLDLLNPILEEYISSLDFYWIDVNFLNSWYCYVFWTIFSLLFLFSIYKIYKKKSEMISIYELLFIGLIPNMVMMLSPTWGFRTTYFTSITMFSITFALIIQLLTNIKYKGKCILVMSKLLYGAIIIYLILIFVIVRNFDNKRLENIKLQFDNGKNEIIIRTCPIRYMWNYNPYMDFHRGVYKSMLVDKKIIKDVNIDFVFEPFDNYLDVYKGW